MAPLPLRISAALALIGAFCVAPGPLAPRAAIAAAPGLHVSGNTLVDGSGAAFQPRGVNRSGMEYACIQGWGVSDGPLDTASVQAIASWGANIVRVPLNEDCWLNINGAPIGGPAYQNAVTGYVSTLESQGLAVILDLHWSAPAGQQATGQQPMPDRDHSPAFWSSVAATFRSDPSVVFDLFNEPYPDGNQDTTDAWTCWRDGGSCTQLDYTAAGMQELVNAVRATGSTNVIMLGGIQYANTLSHWLDYRPSDPAGQLMASDHTYPPNGCRTTACWDASMGAVAQQNPVVIGETGDRGCTAVTFDDQLVAWADAHSIGYLGWTWDTWGACSDYVLITDYYNGTPTSGYGQWWHDHLVARDPDVPPAVVRGKGYWLVASDGGIFPFGPGAAGLGSTGGIQLNRPVVGMTSTPTGHGYWLVASDGGIFPFGDATGYGSTGGIHLNQPIVGMEATPSGRGYWLVASDGGIFPFGDATGYGSTGGIQLNRPIVGMAATPTGRGYWLVASDGGIFPFGDATGYGSTGRIHLNRPIVGMDTTPSGRGYWLVASDGGIFPFGNAAGYGSAGGQQLNQPIVALAATPDGAGYWLVASDGGIFPFGDATGYGSTGGIQLNRPIVGMNGVA